MSIFLLVFVLYLFTLFPGVAPYRDTGEMVSVASTLGIAHPPGYPFYTLVSNVFLKLVPWGNAGYRLNVLSALAGAATAGVFYSFAKALLPGKGAPRFPGEAFSARAAAFVAAFLLAASYLQWYLSLVSEMYTLNTLFAALILLLVYVSGRAGETRDDAAVAGLILAAFLFGLGLGNRTDLLLVAAPILVVAANRGRFSYPRKPILAGIFFAAGFSVYGYLLVRSNQNPLLDWNHPASLAQLWGTLSRKTHGGTLDLISSTYAAGENFLPGIRFYFGHLLGAFAYAGLPLALAGVYSLGKRNRNVAAAALAAWLLSGPLFIYLANLPPNPHALVILEAHFLLPNLIVAVFVAEGMAFLLGQAKGTTAACALLASFGLLACFNVLRHFPHLDKRNNFVAHDYRKNVLRSLPRGSLVVMKEDVQLFSLWSAQFAGNERPDLAVVGQGLAGSAWYQKPFAARHPGVVLSSLRTKEDWQRFIAANHGRGMYVSGDAEYVRPDGYVEEPDGLVSRVTRGETDPRGDILLKHIYPYRGPYRYDAYREFFTPDLIEEYAKAYFQAGQWHLNARNYAGARERFAEALAMKPLMPLAASFTAYSYFAEANYPLARDAYREAAEQYRALRSLADEYRSSPDAKEGIDRDLSDVYLSLGVCLERLGDDDESLSWYRRSLDVSPRQARAHFNRAVVFWKKNDWRNVEHELQSALRIDPGFKEAAFYLEKVREKRPL